MKTEKSNISLIIRLIAIAAVLLLFADYQKAPRIPPIGITKTALPTQVSPSLTALPVQPLAIALLGDHSYRDRPDDMPGQYQIHVLYVVTKDFDYTVRDLDGSINRQIELVNDWFSDQTNGSTLRFDTYEGSLDITLVILPVKESELFSYVLKNYEQYDANYHGFIFLHNALEDWLNITNQTTPFFSPGKLYLTYFESSMSYVCGDGPTAKSRIIGVYPGAHNLRDKNECAAFLGKDHHDLPGVWEHILAHEIIHALGFPSACAKNLDVDHVHIFDPFAQNDIMGTNPGIYDPHPVLDPNHDDYYMTNNPACPDLADSPFLNPMPANSNLPANVLSEPGWRLP